MGFRSRRFESAGVSKCGLTGPGAKEARPGAWAQLECRQGHRSMVEAGSRPNLLTPWTATAPLLTTTPTCWSIPLHCSSTSSPLLSLLCKNLTPSSLTHPIMLHVNWDTSGTAVCDPLGFPITKSLQGSRRPSSSPLRASCRARPFYLVLWTAIHQRKQAHDIGVGAWGGKLQGAQREGRRSSPARMVSRL